MANVSKCNRFEANIFNKAKCQHCFKPKELHSAEALARNKDARKISKCGYLFVAPESFDFSNPLVRTKRWQRRFFVLFDDGELTFSVDENVNTVPQGVIDMNTCTDVYDAEETTSHPFSVAVATKEKCIYFKGMSKEESNRWFDVLVMYPRSTKTRHRRSPQPTPPPTSQQNATTANNKRSERRTRTSYPPMAGMGGEIPTATAQPQPPRPPVGPGADPSHVPAEPSTFRSVRSMKHQNDASYKEKLSKSNSHPNLATETLEGVQPRRRSESRGSQPASSDSVTGRRPSPSPERTRRDSSSISVMNGHTKNETDETKMARSCENHSLNPACDSVDNNNSVFHDDLMYIKKGWLVLLGTEEKDWSKHWFVLSGTKLSYYNDAHAEEAGHTNGVIDLKSCISVEETRRARNYGFILKKPGQEWILSAMTMGIRKNWMEAIQKCLPPVSDVVTAESAIPVSVAPAVRDRRSRRYISMPALGADSIDGRKEASQTSEVGSQNESKTPHARDARSRHTMSSATWAAVIPSKHDEPQKHTVSLQVKPQTVSKPEPLVRTPEQEAELDDVERNIRSIHRRSHQPMLNQQKQSTFESAENDIVPSSSIPVSRAPPLSKHGRSMTESSLPQHSAETNRVPARRKSETKGPAHFRAPSAKVKDRSRAKSPRAKSPPPQHSLDDMIDRVVLGDVDMDISSELTQQTWSQPEELSFERIRHDSEFSDISSPCQEDDGSSTQTNIQKHMEDSKYAQEELALVQAKLDVAMSELAKAEVGLSSSAIALREEQETSVSLQENIEELEGQMKTMETKISKYETKIQGLQQLEKEMNDLHREVTEKSSLLEEQEDELRSSKQQLQNLEEQLILAEDEAATSRAKLEKKFTEQREVLEEELRQLRRQMEKSNDSLSANMVDIIKEKDHTIAQLEERLIENDKKAEELMEEFSLETEEHGKLQQSYSDLEKEFHLVKERHLELQQELEHFEEDMKDVQAEKHDLVIEKNESETRNQLLRTDLEKVEEQYHKQQQEYESLVEDMEKMERELSDLQVALEKKDAALEETKSKLKEGSDEMVKVQGLYVAAQKELETVQQKSESHQQAVASDAVLVDEMKKNFEDIMDEKSKLEDEIDVLKDQIVEQEAQFVEALTEKEDSQKELKKLLVQYDKQQSDLEKELKESQSQVESFNKQLVSKEDSYKQELNDKTNEIVKYEEVLDQLREKLLFTEAALEKQEDLVLSLKSESEESTKNNIEEKFKQADKELKELRTKNQKLEMSLSEADSVVSSLKLEIKNMETGYQDQMSSLGEKVSSLKSKLEAAERRNQRFDRRSKTFETCDSFAQTESMKVTSSDKTEELHSKISGLEKQVIEYELKCKELSSRILRQHDFSLELDKSRNHEAELRDELEMLKGKESGSTLSVSAVLQMQDVQRKLSEKQLALDALTTKLSDVIQQLECESDIVAEDTVVVSQLREVLHSAMSNTEIHDSLSSLSSKDRMRIFAEKLALEALVVTELASVVDLDSWLPEDQSVKLYTAISVADHRLQLLNQMVSVNNTSQLSLPQQAAMKVRLLSDLLAEKLLVQAQFESKAGNVSDALSLSMKGKESSLENLAKIAFEKALVDDQLFVQSSQYSAPTTSVPHGAFIQCELVHVLSRLKGVLNTMHSDTEKLVYIKQEVTSRFKGLQTQQTNINEKVKTYRDSQIVELAKLTVLLGEADTNTNFNREFLETELLHVTKTHMEKYVATYLEEIGNGSEMPGLLEVIGRTISEDTTQAIEDITEAYTQLSKEGVQLNLDESYGSGKASQDTECLKERRSACLIQLAKVMSQKAVIAGQLATAGLALESMDWHVDEEGKSSLSRADSGLPMSPLSELSNMGSRLSRALANEARSKSQIALFLLDKQDGQIPNDIQSEVIKLARELSSIEGRLNSNHGNITHHDLMREAICQAEKSFIRQCLTVKHQEEMQNMAAETQAKLREHQASHDEQIHQLETEIAQLGTLLSENEHLMQLESHDADDTALRLRDELQRRESIHVQEVKALKEGYEIRIRSLQSDIETAQDNLDTSLREKDDIVLKYENEISSTCNELKVVKSECEEVQHEKQRQQEEYSHKLTELEQQVRQGHSDVAEVTEEDKQRIEELREEVEKFKKQLQEERSAHVNELQRLQTESGSDKSEISQSLLNAKIQQLQAQIDNMQGDYEQELALQRAAHRREMSRCKEDLMQLLTAAEAQTPHLNEENLRKRYLKDIDSVKDLYDKGFMTMDRSHQRIQMQMRLAHKQEMEKLRQEKDQLLMEETKATQAALDAMRKAHEEELQKERNKFLDLISKTYSQAELETLQSQHEDDMGLVQWELRQLTEQFSLRCLELASLKERYETQTKSLHASRQRNHELLAKNDEMSCRLKHELERLKRLADKDVPSDDENADVSKLKVAVRVRETEIDQLRDDIAVLHHQLQETEQELDESKGEHSALLSQHEENTRQYQRRLDELKLQVTALEASSMSQLSDDVFTSPVELEGISPVPSFSTPKMASTSSLADDKDSSSSPITPTITSSSRLPQLTSKKTSWRQKQPQRALSNPAFSHRPRLSLPAEAILPDTRRLADVLEGTSMSEVMSEVTSEVTSEELSSAKTSPRSVSIDVVETI